MLTQHVLLGRSRGIADPHAQEEAVELAFGQRIRPFELERVLRGEHQKRRPERPRLAVHGDLAVVHRFEQGALGAGRGAVDLVGQHDLGEERAGLEDELPARLMKDAGADQVAGEQVGRELDAVERTGQAAGQGLGQQRLADAGNVLEQQVAVGQQGDEREVDDVVLAQEDRGDVGLQLVGKLRASAADRGASAAAGASASCKAMNGSGRVGG